MPGPLDGVKVLDLSAIYSGPICATVLGDHGADVIKIEPPEGDLMRGGRRSEHNGLSGPFAMLNRNKRSLVIDLKSDQGKSVFARMIPQADVIVENFRPGVMNRLGFGWDQVKEMNSRMIYASITGFGSEGPYASRRVYDAVIQAMSGFADLQTDPTTGRPQMINTLVCDKVTAMTAAQNICSALYSRSVTGCGQRVEVSMLDASLFFLWPDSMATLTFINDEPRKPSYRSHAHFVRETRDGYIAAMPVKAGEWEGVFASLGIDNLLENDERFNTLEKRRQHMIEFQQAIDDGYKSRTTAELAQLFEKNGVPFAEINQRKDVPNDPQILGMNALVEFEHPQGGAMRQPRPTGRFSDTQTGLFRSSPKLGEHTDEVLREFDFTDPEIESLHRKNVIDPIQPS